jgi:hypothetical protein
MLTLTTQIVGKRDLAQLCRVSKLCLRIAQPQLDRVVEVEINHTITPALCQMLAIDNAGLNSVREVILIKDPHYGPVHQTSIQQLDIIVNRLTQNTLKSFH